MSDRKLSFSFKGGVGYEAPLFSIGGDSVEELNYQLDALINAGSLQKAAAIAIAFQNGYRSLRHGDTGGQEPPQETYSQPPVGAQPSGGYQGPPASQTAPQGDPWASQPPPQDPWANQGPPPAWAGGGQQQQQQPPPQQGGGRPPVCQCGQPMEYKVTTGSGKPVWRCRQWRYNNGNPTPNHDQIWVEGNR